MNNLFISFYGKEEKEELKKILENKVDYYKYHLLKYHFTKDLLNNDFGNNMSLKLDYEYILQNGLANKHTIKMWHLKQNLRKEFFHFLRMNVIFDKNFDALEEEKKEIKEYLFQVLKCHHEMELCEIESQNQMYQNDRKHIEDFLKTSKIHPDKLKILVILNDVKDYQEEKIKEYINEYKHVDILKMPGITKLDSKEIMASIDCLNEEYGSTIDMIQKKNIQEYQIYLMYSKVNYEDFSTHYVLRKKCKYIDMRNEDMDRYNQNICEFEKNQSYLFTLSNRLNMDLARYSKNKVGKVIQEK